MSAAARTSDMARTRPDDLWALAHAERAALAEDLAELSAETLQANAA